MVARSPATEQSHVRSYRQNQSEAVLRRFDRISRPPTLIIHGTADKTVPIDPSARGAAKGIPHATLIEYDGEPHGLFATAPERLNEDLLAFLSR